MKKTIIVSLTLGLGAGLAFSQLGQYPNVPKPNDSAQILAFKSATSQNGGLMVPAHDSKVYTYSGSNLISITYKVGGKNGRTVGMLRYSYSGSDLIDEELTVQ